jgi:FkbM family methyltransferase
MDYLTKLFSKKIFIFIRKLILHFSLKISGYKNYGNFYKTGEEQVFKLIKKNKITNCLDIGAHVGEFSKRLLELGNMNIIAFEPMQKTFLKLKKIETKYQKSFKCFNVALSNKRGWAEIYYTNPLSQLSSISINLNKINFLKSKKIKKQKISIDTLDNFSKKNEKFFRKKIDFIKIDTEGHDLKVLVGATKFIDKNKPKFIQVEMNYHYLFSGENLYQFSKQIKGYDIYQIMPFNNGLIKINPSRPENNIFHLSNFLFIKRKK